MDGENAVVGGQYECCGICIVGEHSLIHSTIYERFVK